MGVKLMVAFVCIVGITTGLPVTTPEQNGNQPYVPGVFLSAEAFKNLQDRANSNERPQISQPNESRSSDQSPVLKMNQEQQTQPNQQPSQNYLQNQPIFPTNQQPMTQQIPQQSIMSQPQVVLQNQPLNQPQLIQQNQQPLLAQPQNQQYVVAQPNQQPLYISQQPSNPIIVAQQPGQGLIYQTQSQPTYISSVPQNSVIANPIPSNHQNQGSYYAMVPVNSQNSPTNVGGTYLVPVQQNMPSTPILVNAGK